MNIRSAGPRSMITIARVWGVPVRVSPTWLLIALVLTLGYGPIVHDAVPGTGTASAYLVALGFAALFGVCILAHEIGHTVVSRLLGYSVSRITLFLLGGVSEIEGEPRRPRDELLISAAGPLVSVVLALALFGAYRAAPHDTLIAVLLLLLSWSNAVLAMFNLLPGLPLDGGRILRAAVWGLGSNEIRGTRVAGWAGRGLAVLVAVSGLIVDRTSVGLLAGIVTLLLAAYLWTGASAGLRVAGVQERLPAVRVTDLLRPGVLVPDTTSLADALGRAAAGNVRAIVLTDAGARPSGIVDDTRALAVPEPRRPWTPVAEVARAFAPGTVLPVDIGAAELLDRMQAVPAREYLMVAADGAPAGIITTVDFARVLNARRRR